METPTNAPPKDTQPIRRVMYDWELDGSSGAMYREGDTVEWEYTNYDGEDGRSYGHSMSFPLVDFMQKLQDIRAKGSVRVEDVECHMDMSIVKEKGIDMLKGSYFGRASDNAPGGAQVWQNASFSVPMEKVLAALS